jgi:hypothetical protein
MAEIDDYQDPETVDPGEGLDEILPLPFAIEKLAPGKVWALEGDSLEGLVWYDDINDKPSDEDIIAKAKEIKAKGPMVRLRQLRDVRLKEVDWVTLRSVRTGEPIPDEWQEYMQALADITETSPNPKFSAGELINVEWPERPDGLPAGLLPGELYRIMADT